jgi:hypothetical protein
MHPYADACAITPGASFRQHKLSYLLAVLCLFAILAGGYYHQQRSNDPKYITAAVRRGDLTALVQATDTINQLIP